MMPQAVNISEPQMDTDPHGLARDESVNIRVNPWLVSEHGRLMTLPAEVNDVA